MIVILIFLVPLAILVLDGFLAHWIVKKFIPYPHRTKNEKFWRALLAFVIFAILGTLSIYLLLMNFRFER